jgi:hypothetical protein
VKPVSPFQQRRWIQAWWTRKSQNDVGALSDKTKNMLISYDKNNN